MGERERRNLFLARNMNIATHSEIIRRQQLGKVQEENEDTKNRKTIQAFIRDKVKEGKSREEILKRLKFVYGGKQYMPYRQYFEKWVDFVIESGKGERE